MKGGRRYNIIYRDRRWSAHETCRKYLCTGKIQRNRNPNYIGRNAHIDHLLCSFSISSNWYHCQFWDDNSSNCHFYGKYTIFRLSDPHCNIVHFLFYRAAEMEAAQKILGVVKYMDYQTMTVWTVIKRFLIGWIIAGALLVIASCVKYKEFIMAAFSNNTRAWINEVMPILIILFAIGYIIRALFT